MICIEIYVSPNQKAQLLKQMPTATIITEPSICIPRTLNKHAGEPLNWRVVKDTFEKLLGKGTVERVDIVTPRDDDQQFRRVFVHMRYWPMDNPSIATWRQTLLDGGELKVVHDHPWFWKCKASRVPKPDRKKPVSCEPYIMSDAPTVEECLPIQDYQQVTPNSENEDSEDM